MNSGTAENRIKVILDTNILISAIGFGGIPREIFLLPNLPNIENSINESFLVVHPKESINIVRDKDDNRVLEAAVEGNCDFIITGDKDLLDLREFKNIKIIAPAQFLAFASAL